MGGIRKASQPYQDEDFRRRLQRALSLSPSDSDSAEISLRSAEDDTSEIESLREENGVCSLQHETNLGRSILQDATEDWTQREELLGAEPNIQGEATTSDNRSMIAFQCIAELDTRVKSIQGSLSTLADKVETICSDLDDIVYRLRAVEAAVETLAPEN
ncbi:hypothetical protein N7490_006793 [Penicillium lividum]|nr:hypothetical protein N7490_006793 [Penicillium lividum]